jgi:Arm domain-containing DNA-binding protein
VLTETQLRRVKSLRAPRKLFDGVHLLVTPRGGRYWRYNYRFNGKQKTLSLGVYPDVSLATARARHQEAQRLLAEGIEPPSIKKRAFGPVVSE